MYVAVLRLPDENGLKFRSNVGEPLSAAMSIEDSLPVPPEAPWFCTGAEHAVASTAAVAAIATTCRTERVVRVMDIHSSSLRPLLRGAVHAGSARCDPASVCAYIQGRQTVADADGDRTHRRR
ncbi:hypothetical protein GCM10009600_29870 [Oerskovia paurometabola]